MLGCKGWPYGFLFVCLNEGVSYWEKKEQEARIAMDCYMTTIKLSEVMRFSINLIEIYDLPCFKTRNPHYHQYAGS